MAKSRFASQAQLSLFDCIHFINSTGQSSVSDDWLSQEGYAFQNYSIGAGFVAPVGELESFNANISAIQTIRKIEQEARCATISEQEILARYVGWGGLANAFANIKGKFKAGWKQRGEELARLVSVRELAAMRSSILNGFYTSPLIVDQIYRALRRLGYAGGLVLEPSAGAGNFIGHSPSDLRNYFVAVEKDKITAAICKNLYPKSLTIHQGFEKVTLPKRTFDLVVGNVPFGNESLRFGASPEFNRFSIHNQFVLASLDALTPNGMMALVVSRYLLDAKSNDARRAIARKAALIGAIRLPESAFLNAGTRVVADILFLQKHDLETERKIAIGEIQCDSVDWESTVETVIDGERHEINNYFVQNPAMVLGDLCSVSSRYGRNELTVVLSKGLDLSLHLSRAVNQLPKCVIPEELYTDDEEVQERFNSLSESLDLSSRGLEEGAIFYESGSLVRVIERSLPGDDFGLTKQYLSPVSPWSQSLSMDEYRRWYTQTVALDEQGRKIKKGRLNQYQRLVYQNESDVPQTLRLGSQRFEKLSQLITVRDRYKRQLELESLDDNSLHIEANRRSLKEAYENFTTKFGPINAPRNRLVIGHMPDEALLISLEKEYRAEVKEWTGKYRGKQKIYNIVSQEFAEPSDILSKRIAYPKATITKADNVFDALSICLSELGRIDLPRIASLVGISEAKAKTLLYTRREKPLIYFDYDDNRWVTHHEYLSGNVVKKLKAATAYGEEKAVTALTAVLPEPIGAENITVRLGMSWVPDEIYSAFLAHITGVSGKVRRLKQLNSYNVVGDASTVQASDYGTERANAVRLLSDILNNKQTRIYDATLDDKRVLNFAETELANLKRDQINLEFAEWVFLDADRREPLVKAYNDEFNVWAQREYDGSHLMFPGKVSDSQIKLRRQQTNGIWRGIIDRFVLYDHAVGAGKTYTGIGRAMERRRMGLSNKPVIVVPNHMVVQFTADIYRLYPTAKVLTAGKKGFERKNRRRLFARVASGDWDIVVIPHSSFGFISISRETEERYLLEELKLAELAIAEAIAQDEEDGFPTGRKSYNVKEAERFRAGLETKLEKLRATTKDSLITFEEMGIDDVTVDESHEFKNLFYHSRLSGVRGMGDKSGSQKAFDLYQKARILLESGGALAFMSGTPISNSAVEMYTNMRYLAAGILEESGMSHFDAWRSQFVSVSAKFEPTEYGTLKEVNRLGRTWSNMRNLMDVYRLFADMVSNEDIKTAYREDHGKEYPLPKVKGGGRQSVVVPPTPAQQEFLNVIIDGFRDLENILDPYERNKERLRLMDKARKVSLDVRAVDPLNASDEKGGKLDVVSIRVAELYKRWNAERGTQLIFLDRSVKPAKCDQKKLKDYDSLNARFEAALKSGDEDEYRKLAERFESFDSNEIDSLRIAQAGGWNAYDQLKANLVALGIPEKEIRFIQQASTDKQKQELFDAVNDGEVRVLIGSTPKMGAGTNVQRRLVALHHVDVTWKPSCIEQREGRIIRPGNWIGFDIHGNVIRNDFEVDIYAYVTERTVDAKMWDLNATKLKMINAIRHYDGAFTMDFEDEDCVSMEEIAALATGDPLMLERVQLKSEIDRLELLERFHRRRIWGLHDEYKRAKQRTENCPGQIERERFTISLLCQGIEAAKIDTARRVTVVNGEECHAYGDTIQKVAGLRGGSKNVSVNLDGKQYSDVPQILDYLRQRLGTPDFLAHCGGTDYRCPVDLARRILDSIGSVVLANKEARRIAVGTLYNLRLVVDVAEVRTNVGDVELIVLDDYGDEVFSDCLSQNYSQERIKNALHRIASHLRERVNGEWLIELERQLAWAKQDLPLLKEKLNERFDSEEILIEKRKRYEEIVHSLCDKGEVIKQVA